MDIRLMVRFLLLHSVFIIVSAQSEEYSNCEVKTKTTSYLDVATQMIRNAKESYRPCPSMQHKAIDCEEILKAGHNESKVYTVWPNSRVLNGRSIDVFCDMDTDGGGWTVLQRRGNFSRPKDYFFQDWKAYKTGFGNIEKDFWLGNDNIFALSNQRLTSIRFDLKDVEGQKRYALYDTFWIDDEDHKYTLHIGGYSGDAGDSMIGSHNNNKFTTKDQDNDNEANQSCSQLYKGGWWYGACHASNLNGLYLRGKHESYADGVVWHSWKGHHESMDTTEIKIRSKDFRKILNPLVNVSPTEAMTPE
ncbi:Techylectin-5A like protein [Argiope bruennichi]|uniref:Techylectin-5A like protein n=1 Tax=Argiope bruennichi TaxID=94029 RepID=A0A8T0EPB0_ARGBR|nr:Techylectin-5A like protein [Argiope bruennichi]